MRYLNNLDRVHLAVNRRQFGHGLATLVFASTSGCLADSSSDPTEEDSDQPEDSPRNESTSQPEDARREVELVAVGDVPDDVPLSATLEVRRPWITENRTAVLELEMTNEGSSTVETSPLYVQGASADAGDPGVLVLGTSGIQQSSEPAHLDVECWENPEPSVDQPSFSSANPPQVELAPGETGSFDLIVDDDPSVEGCFPPGTYRFERRNTDGGTSFRWGFTLEVADVSNAG